jgi:hypothetical protein
MSKFRKKPVEIEAYQLGNDDGTDLVIWINVNSDKACAVLEGDSIIIETLEGKMTASPGDWVIRGVAGEFYPCKPEIFQATYDPV